MRHSIRLRGFAAGFGAIALVISMVAPVSAAGPSPDAATLVARLTASKDPDAAFLNLSSADQKAVVAYLTVAGFDSSESIAQTAAPDSLTECWTITKTFVAKNYLGGTLFTMWSKINWCANQSTLRLTSASKYRGFTVNTLGWNWLGWQAWDTEGGVGYGHYEVYLQGGFSFCVPLVGCIDYRYPWIDTTVYYDGSVSGSMGG